jgi:hypothetical protein
MPSLSKTTYETREELGQALAASHPPWANRDPEEIADAFLESKYGPQVKINPTEYGNIDWETLVSNLPGDVWDTGIETLAAIPELIWNWEELAGASKGALSLLGAPIAATPREQQMARAMKAGFLETLSPRGIQERPAEALSNTLGLLVPGFGATIKGAALGGKLGKMGNLTRAAETASKGMTKARKVADWVDPGMAQINLAKGGAKALKLGAGKFTKGYQSGDKPFTDFGGKFLSIYSGTPWKSWATLMGRSVDPVATAGKPDAPVKFAEETEKFRMMGEGERNNKIAARAFHMIDVMQEKAQNAYRATQQELAGVLNRHIDDDVYNGIMGNVAQAAKVLGKVERKELQTVLGKPPVPEYSIALSKDLTDLVGNERGEVKTIVESILNNKVDDAVVHTEAIGTSALKSAKYDPPQITWRHVENWKKQLDLIISSKQGGTGAWANLMSDPLGANAAKSLKAIRSVLKQALDENLPAEYHARNKKYLEAARLRNFASNLLGLVPNQVRSLADADGNLPDNVNLMDLDVEGAFDTPPSIIDRNPDNVKLFDLEPKTIEMVVKKLKKAYSGDNSGALQTIEELERQTGAPAISPGIVADNLSAPFAKGLVGRAAVHGLLGYVITGSTLSGVLAAIPLLYLLSPSKLQSSINTWLPRYKRGEDLVSGVGRSAPESPRTLRDLIPNEKVRDKFKQMAKSLPYLDDLMTRELGEGFLRKAMLNQWTLGTTARHLSEVREELERSFTAEEKEELQGLTEPKAENQINVDNLKTRR